MSVIKTDPAAVNTGDVSVSSLAHTLSLIQRQCEEILHRIDEMSSQLSQLAVREQELRTILERNSELEPHLERLGQVDLLHVFLGAGSRPATAAYWELLRARPAYREAITAHEHGTVTRGRERLREAKAQDPALRSLLEGA